jgi:hypothetical protein
MKNSKMLLFVMLLSFFSFAIFADNMNVVVDYVAGQASYKNFDNDNWKVLAEGTVLKQGSIIKTEDNSIVDLKYDEKTFSRISSNSSVEVQQAETGSYTVKKLFFKKVKPLKKISLKLNKGNILSKVGKLNTKSSFSIQTPTAVCGVRGTLFGTSFGAKTKVNVISGVVAVSSPSMPNVQTLVMPGQSTVVNPGQAPEQPKTMTTAEIGEVQGLMEGASSTGNSDIMNAPTGQQIETAAPTSTPTANVTDKVTSTVTSNVTNTVVNSVIETVTTNPIVKNVSKIRVNVNIK